MNQYRQNLQPVQTNLQSVPVAPIQFYAQNRSKIITPKSQRYDSSRRHESSPFKHPDYDELFDFIKNENIDDADINIPLSKLEKRLYEIISEKDINNEIKNSQLKTQIKTKPKMEIEISLSFEVPGDNEDISKINEKKNEIKNLEDRLAQICSLIQNHG